MARSKKPSGRSERTQTPRRERIVKQIFLIVSEGETTERYYLKTFEQPWSKVLVQPEKGSAEYLVDKAIAKGKDNPFEEVWVVFDLDYDPSRGNEQYHLFTQAINKAEKAGIRVAYSIDAFELWFRLHYEPITGHLSRKQLYEDLSRRWDINYERDGKTAAFTKGIKELLEIDENASLQEAITRSERLYEERSHLPYQEQGSVTTIHLLIHNLTTEDPTQRK